MDGTAFKAARAFSSGLFYRLQLSTEEAAPIPPRWLQALTPWFERPFIFSIAPIDMARKLRSVVLTAQGWSIMCMAAMAFIFLGLPKTWRFFYHL